MATARIIADSEQDAQTIAERLRSAGFRVEVVRPGETPATSADVEITLSKVNTEAVLARVMEITKRSPDMDVFIAPGVFAPAVPEAQTAIPDLSDELALPPGPNTADAVSGVVAGLKNRRVLLAKALQRERALKNQARRLRKAAEAEAAQDRAVFEAQPGSSMATGMETELPPGFAPEALSLQEGTPQPLSCDDAVSDGASSAPAEFAVELTPETSAFAQTPNVPVQEFRESESPATAADIAESSRTVYDKATAAVQSSVAAADTHGPRRKSVWHPSLPRSRRAREWWAAAAISAVIAVLVSLAWSIAQRGRVAPLDGSLVSPVVEEQVPFGPATATPGGSRKVGPAAMSPAAAQPPTRPAPLRATPESASLQKGDVHKKAADRSFSGRRAGAGDYDEEVIVRHFNRKPGRPPRVQKTAIKHFSDMEE